MEKAHDFIKFIIFSQYENTKFMLMAFLEHINPKCWVFFLLDFWFKLELLLLLFVLLLCAVFLLFLSTITFRFIDDFLTNSLSLSLGLFPKCDTDLLLLLP